MDQLSTGKRVGREKVDGGDLHRVLGPGLCTSRRAREARRDSIRSYTMAR